MTDTQELDLDALIPETRLVKLGGKSYKVSPPSLRILPELSRKLSKISKLENNENVEEIAQALEDLNATVKLVMPELPEDTELSVAQCTAVIQLIMEMVTPPEQKALAEQGLLPDSKKKIDLVS